MIEGAPAALVDLFEAVVALDDHARTAAIEIFTLARDREHERQPGLARFFNATMAVLVEARDEVKRQRQALEDAAAMVTPTTIGREAEDFLRSFDTPGDGDAL